VSVDFSLMADSNVAWFGETVVYRPAGGDARTITAVVLRRPPEGLRASPSVLRPYLAVLVKNDATEGISAAELDIGQDSIEVARRVGGTPERMSIARILSQHNGMIELEVR